MTIPPKTFLSIIVEVLTEQDLHPENPYATIKEEGRTDLELLYGPENTQVFWGSRYENGEKEEVFQIERRSGMFLAKITHVPESERFTLEARGDDQKHSTNDLTEVRTWLTDIFDAVRGRRRSS